MIVSGSSYGKVKNISTSVEKKLKQATPSMAVEILGLNSAPNAGEAFQVVSSEKEAREISEFRINQLKDKKVLKQKDDTLGNIFENMGADSKKILNVLIKTDVAGTAEAISSALKEISSEEYSIKVVSSGVGGISESDVNLAIATESMIFGFNVRADNTAKKLIESEQISLNYHSIIYELIDDIKAKLTGILDPIVTEEIVGVAEVLEVFNSPKFGQVAVAM